MELKTGFISIKTTTMPSLILCFLLAIPLISCSDKPAAYLPNEDINPNDHLLFVKDISLPGGFNYIKTTDTSYSDWLLNLKLKPVKTVYLYNGKLKPNQQAQFAVLDQDIGKKNLVQCADVAIKLRSDYLFQINRFDEIEFNSTSGDRLSFQLWQQGMRWREQSGKLVQFYSGEKYTTIENSYRAFMELVYSYCGTYSLNKQLNPVADPALICPGNIFIQGGFPGHTVTVMAVAKNNDGEIVFLLSQGYMPAQDIHILKNYSDPSISPWFSINDIYPLYTPQWKFERGSLKRW